MKIGLVSDIHEDLYSFQRALAVLQQEGCEAIYCLGDLLHRETGSLFARLDSATEVVKLVKQHCDATVVGNHDLEMIHRLPIETPPSFEVPADFFSLDPHEQQRLRMQTIHPKGLWFIGKPTLPINVSEEQCAWLATRAEVIVADVEAWRLAFMHSFKPNTTGFCVVYADPQTLTQQMQWQREKSIQVTFSGHGHELGLKIFVDGDAKFHRVPFEEVIAIDPQRRTWLSIPAVLGAQSKTCNGVAMFDTTRGTAIALPLRGGAFFRHHQKSVSANRANGISTRRFEIAGRGKGGGACRYRIRMRNPFDAPGNQWLKGNLHCHLGGHVGGLGKANAMAEAYQRLGYDFLASTDHNLVTPCRESNEAFVVIPGVETDRPHILSLGVDAAPPNRERNDGYAIASLTETVAAAGGLTIMPHPTLTGWSWDDLCRGAAAGVEGFEVVHAKGRYWAGKWRADQIYMMLLSQGYRLAAIGSDDCHWNEEDPYGEICRGHAWTGVWAAERSVGAILDAIRLRQTYASEGPVIHALRFEEPAALVVECSPCVACYFRSDRHGTTAIIHENAPCERFVLDLTQWGFRVYDYVVAVLQDTTGRFAWTSPIDVSVETV